MTFGERLKKIRKEKGLSQIQLSEKSGISQTAISAYERDRNLPTTYPLLCLSKALGVQTSDLFMETKQADASTNADLDTAIFLLNSLPPESLKEATNYLSFLAHKASADKK